jgi:hypothetical protein
MSLTYFNSYPPDRGLDKIIRNAVSIESIDGGFRVTTHCMYPSNGLVRVTVRSGVETIMATDEGGAVGEAMAAGLVLENPDNLLRHLFRDQGLRISNGIIYSPTVPIADVNIAIIQVANAAKEAAHWLYQHVRVKKSRDFAKLLSQYLELTFTERLSHKRTIVGKSNKAHKFDNVVSLQNDSMLIVDPVKKEASSINARVVANLDVRALENPNIYQRIVYDDEDNWSASDLNLLQVGATVVPFSRARDVISRIAGNPRTLGR